MGHLPNQGGNVTEKEVKDYCLQYLDASQPVGDTSENETSFITDIDEFNKHLPFVPVEKVDLAQC